MPAQGHGPEQLDALQRQDDFVGSADDLVAQGAKKVEMFGTRPKRRFLNDAVDVSHSQVIGGRDLEIAGAVFHKLGRCPLSGPDAALDGGGALGRNDRVVAVRQHQPLVSQGDGFGAPGPALGKHRDDRDLEHRHFVQVSGYLLRGAGVVLDGIGARSKHIGVNGNVFCFGHLHVVQGIGVAPGLHGASVAEFLSVPLFLPDDHDRLMMHALAGAARDIGAGDDHARVDGVFVLPADLGIVVVDVLEDVLEADTLRMAYDPHLVHRGELVVELVLEKDEKVFQRGQLLHTNRQ